MKNISAIALFVVATFIAAGPAIAQNHQVTATIPFNFTVGERTVPSGDYSIGSEMNSPSLLAIRNWDKKIAIVSLVLPNEGGQGQNNTLVFHKYGNQYFLSDIRSDSASMHIHFRTTKAEMRARAQVEEARLSVDEPVLIALK